jgi:hypothetical protein
VPNGGFISGTIEFETMQGSDSGVLVTNLDTTRGNASTYTYSRQSGGARWNGASALASMKFFVSAGDITGVVRVYRYQ